MVNWFGRNSTRPEVSPVDKAMFARLDYLIKRTDAMALDVSKLTAAVARNDKAVAALVASHSDPAGQKAVDDATAALDVVSGTAEAAVAPPAAPAA